MSYVYYNPNPDKKSVGDCVVRALSAIFDDTFEVLLNIDNDCVVPSVIIGNL